MEHLQDQESAVKFVKRECIAMIDPVIDRIASQIVGAGIAADSRVLMDARFHQLSILVALAKNILTHFIDAFRGKDRPAFVLREGRAQQRTKTDPHRRARRAARQTSKQNTEKRVRSAAFSPQNAAGNGTGETACHASGDRSVIHSLENAFGTGAPENRADLRPVVHRIVVPAVKSALLMLGINKGLRDGRQARLRLDTLEYLFIYPPFVCLAVNVDGKDPELDFFLLPRQVLANIVEFLTHLVAPLAVVTANFDNGDHVETQYRCGVLPLKLLHTSVGPLPFRGFVIGVIFSVGIVWIGFIRQVSLSPSSP